MKTLLYLLMTVIAFCAAFDMQAKAGESFDRSDASFNSYKTSSENYAETKNWPQRNTFDSENSEAGSLRSGPEKPKDPSMAPVGEGTGIITLLSMTYFLINLSKKQKQYEKRIF